MDYLAEFEKLRLAVPRLALHNVNGENSAYCSHAVNNRNCYLSHGSVDNEDCLYCTTGYSNNKDCVDCFVFNQCQLCYECLDILRCYNGSFLQDCIDCVSCTLCLDCIGCQDCFGCIGLRQKKFHILNQSYTKESYNQKCAELKKNFSAAERMFEELKRRTPLVASREMNAENCLGDYIYSSRKAYVGFDVKNCEDVLYVDSAINSKDCADCSHMGFAKGSEYCYESESLVDSYNCNYSDVAWYCSDMEYCDLCFYSDHCFLSVGLIRGSYCILNQPHEPEVWRKKVAAIKEEMKQNGEYGRFFNSAFPWPDTKVMDFYPNG